MPRTVHLHPLACRSLAAAGLAGAVDVTYKSDGRSTVWRTAGPQGVTVVKRFNYSPGRQWLSVWVGQHPAQIELRCHRRLLDAGVPVVPIIDGGVERHRGGCRAWLATSLAGESMQRLITQPDVRAERGEDLIAAAADLAVALVAAGFWSRDLKPSNIIIDDAGKPHLIDTGSIRRHPTPVKIERMLAVMDKVLKRDGVEDVLRQRFATLVRQRLAQPATSGDQN